MNALISYQSKTGFTKKYAQWIAKKLSGELMEISQVSQADILSHELVIHGGWIMGGRISGLDKIRKLNPKKLIVFGVGFTPKQQADTAYFISINKLGSTPFFYCEGGMNPKKMGFVGRAMVKMATKVTPEYADNTDENQIEELVKLAMSY